MSRPGTAVAPRRPRPLHPPGLPAPAGVGRGVTVIRDRVVEKITAQVVSELDLATGAPPELLGIRIGGVRRGTPARVDATITGDRVGVRIAMSVRWPAPIRQVTRNVRERVTERVGGLTGLRVGWVDIDVTALPGRGLSEGTAR